MTVRPPGAPALQDFRYSDIDQYRQAVRSIDVEFTPLSRRISAHQMVLHLRGCDINLIRSFPRLLDAELARNCTSVGFTMDDRFPIRFNGVENDRSLLAVGHGGAGYKSLESATTQFASIMFTPEIKGRGWPAIGRQFAIFAITSASQQRLRDLVLEVMRFAGESPDALQVPGTRTGIRESLLAAVDQALATAISEQIGSRSSSRQFCMVQKIEDIICADIAAPIYSEELARQLGVSVSAMDSAVLQFRGMSLHRYLRSKRLWLVRRQLQAGEVSVKACALAHGFWHLGDFSRSYRLVFGETPSETLKNAR
jgi:AraC-like DNA-binding protein